MPDLDEGQLPEREFFFGVRIVDISYFKDYWYSIQRLAKRSCSKSLESEEYEGRG